MFPLRAFQGLREEHGPGWPLVVKQGAFMAVSDDFSDFVRSNCGASDSGTASSYKAALDKLKIIFTANKPEWVPEADLWKIDDPKLLNLIYEKVLEEQTKFIKGEDSIFEPYRGRGDSYFRKRWCSAALRCYALFRAGE